MSDELIPDAAPIDPAPVIDAPVVDETIALGEAYDRLTREYNRDEIGRFAADGSKIDSPDAVNIVAQDDGAESVAAVPPPVAGTLAPAHLPQAIKADWDKIPETSRTAIAAHQAEMDRKFGEIGKQYGLVKPFADTLSQAMQTIPECVGMSPTEMAQAALQLAAVQSGMNKNPVGTLLEIAETYGVKDQLASLFTGQEYKPSGDTGALQRKIAELETQIQRTSNPEAIRTEISRTMAEKDAETVTQNFIAGEGKEYWADVEAKLPTFIKMVLEEGGQKTQSQILSAAYNMAINAIPEVRAKVRAAEAKATAAAPNPKRADDVRKAVSINIKPTANGKDAPMTEEQALGAAYDRMMAH